MADDDLSRRLRAYEGRIPDADPPDLSVVGARRASGWPVLAAGSIAATAAIAIALVVLLNAVPARLPDVGPSPSPSGSGVAAATPGGSAPASSAESEPAAPTPAPAATDAQADGRSVTWTEGMPPDGNVRDVIWLEDRWLAAGSVGEDAASWTSADGLAWVRGTAIGPETVVDADGFATGYWITTLIRFNDEVLAFGWNKIGCCDNGRPVMWRSPDGIEWSFVDTGETTFDSYHFPMATVTAPNGDLVLLSARDLGGSTSVFTSTDSTAWDEHVVTRVESGQIILAIAASPELIVGVGAGVWTSPDGRQWRSVPGPGANATLISITWDSHTEQFIAAGADESGRAAVWVSRDASSWSETALTEEPGNVADVAASDGLIVATGLIGAYPSERAAAWASVDGRTWQVSPLTFPGAGMIVATRDGRAVAWLESFARDPDYRTVPHVWAAQLAD